MYWLENIVFIFLFIVVEVFMSSIMYLKMFIHTFSLPQSLLYKIGFVVFWLIFGMFVELFFVGYDTYNVFKILSHHSGHQKIEVDNSEETEQEIVERKINIYTQIRETLKELYCERLKEIEDPNEEKPETVIEKDVKSNSNSRSNTKNYNKSIYSMITKKHEEKEINPSKISHEHFGFFSFPMSHIITRWKIKYYSKNKQSYTQINQGSPSNKNRSDNQNSITKRNGTQNVSETPREPKRYGNMDESANKSVSVIDDDPEEFNIDDMTESIAKEFLDNFIITDEGSSNNSINLVLFFKSIPFDIKKENYKRFEFFRYKLFQESLVAYLNKDEVNAFEYHDEKNRIRVSLVKQQLIDQKKSLKAINDSLANLESTIDQNAAKLGKDLNDDINNRPEDKKIYAKQPVF